MRTLLVFARALGFLIPLERPGFATPAITPGPTKTTRIPFRSTLQSKEFYRTILPTLFMTATGSGRRACWGRSLFITRLK
jgi:hypothetical protein